MPATPAIPTVGRIVHVTLFDAKKNLVVRPGIIVRVWGDAPTAAVNLQVFTDGAAPAVDYNDGLPSVFWVTSATYQEQAGIMAHSWSWPARN